MTEPANQFVAISDALVELMELEAEVAASASEKRSLAVTMTDPETALMSTLSAAVNCAISFVRKAAASKLLRSPPIVKAVVTADM